MKLYKRAEPSSPRHNTITGHFPTREALFSALRERASQDDDCEDIVAMLPVPRPNADPVIVATDATSEGYVYLLRSGDQQESS